MADANGAWSQIPDWAWAAFSWLIVLGLPIFWGWVYWPDVQRRLAARHVAPAPSGSTPPTPTIAAPQRPVPTEASARTTENITPEYLANLYTEQTFAQAGTTIASYQGYWIEVAGRIENVMALGPSGSMAFLQGRPSGAGPTRIVSVTLNFHGEEATRANVLSRGDQVRIRGQIGRVHPNSVTLDNCELVGL